MFKTLDIDMKTTATTVIFFLHTLVGKQDENGMQLSLNFDLFSTLQ